MSISSKIGLYAIMETLGNICKILSGLGESVRKSESRGKIVSSSDNKRMVAKMSRGKPGKCQ